MTGKRKAELVKFYLIYYKKECNMGDSGENDYHYYRERADAEKRAGEIKKGGYGAYPDTVKVFTSTLVKVGDDYYDHDRILSVVSPSRLEEHAQETVALKLDNERVAPICVSPFNKERIK